MGGSGDAVQLLREQILALLLQFIHLLESIRGDPAGI